MKTIRLLISTILIFSMLFVACKRLDNVTGVEKVGNYSVSIEAPSTIPGITSTEGLKIVFENFAEGFRSEHVLGDKNTNIEGLIPGLYSINISGRVENEDGDAFYVSGSKINYAITTNQELINIPVSGLKISPLIFSEIFFAGTAPSYFRNQFYEIYNNSDKLIYLDGVYFANLAPITATTTLPLWPATDGDKYVYADRIWKVPGNGSDYPLQPGESFIISQFAANHQLPIYNPASPLDATSSEFEFNMNNANFPDQPAVDMVHVYVNGSAVMTGVQYLTSVFGPAIVIFRVPEGYTYDPANDTDLQTRDLATTRATLYGKIPISYILDAVESGHNENMINAKRVASVLDAGMTYVGATYNSKSVARKVIATNDDGTPILMDTNNSTDDFERGLVPQFRRHGSKMPSWNHTLGGR